MSITHLVELQEVDSQLDDLNSLLGDLPKMVEELSVGKGNLAKFIKGEKNNA